MRQHSIVNVAELVQRINEKTPHHAFMNFQGHVNMILVYINHGKTQYTDKDENARMLQKETYINENEHLNGLVYKTTLDELEKELQNFLEVHSHATA